jgi:hypothetical protein
MPRRPRFRRAERKLVFVKTTVRCLCSSMKIRALGGSRPDFDQTTRSG